MPLESPTRELRARPLDDFPAPAFPAAVSTAPVLLAAVLVAAAGALAVVGGPLSRPAVVVAVVALGVTVLLQLSIVRPAQRLRREILAEVVRPSATAVREFDRIVRALGAGRPARRPRWAASPGLAAVLVAGAGLLLAALVGTVTGAAVPTSTALVDGRVATATTAADLRHTLQHGLTGVEAVASGVRAGEEQRAVEAVLEARPVFRGATLLGPDGVPVASAGRLRIDSARTDAVLRPGLSHLGSPDAAPLLVAAAPAAGGLVLAAEYDVRGLNDALGSAGRMQVLDGQDRIVLSNEGYLPLVPLADAGLAAVVADARLLGASTVEGVAGGVSSAVSAHRLGVGDAVTDLGWTVLHHRALSTAGLAADPTARFTVVVLGMCLAALLAAGAWLWLMVLRPLARLGQHAEAVAGAVAGGPVPEPLAVARLDEIGAVTAALNRALLRIPAPQLPGPVLDGPGDVPATGPLPALVESGGSVTVLFGLYLLGCGVLLVAGVLEQRRHHRTLAAIPHRIVVNGIRGKSSITRLCAGALRGGGLVTVAKTTGSAARFIGPSGEEEPVYRKFGLANIVEQIGIVRRAEAHRPDALVIECMAVLPDLQEVNERKLVRSTVCVICNVREDHLDEMGPTLDDVARSLSRSMPVGGLCITAEQDRIDVLREEAARRRCRLVQVDPGSVTDAEIARFPWITFKENVAIAIEVARLHGIGRADALAGMVAARPDPGTVTVRSYDGGNGRRVDAANVFAANDPASTLMNVTLLTERGLIGTPLNVVINCRPDRVERNGQMGELTGELDPAAIVLIGEQTRSARVAVPPRLADRVVDLGGPLRFPALLDALVPDATGRASLVAIGNIHGQGEVLLGRLAALPPARAPERAAAARTGPLRVPSPHAATTRSA